MSAEEITFFRSKHDKQNPYVLINREMLRDKSLSPAAKGTLCYLLSLPDNWRIFHAQLQTALNIGEHALNTIMEELLAAGYAARSRKRGEHGRFLPYQYEISENKIFPPDGVSQPGSSGPVKPVLRSNESPNGDIQKNEGTKEGSFVPSSVDPPQSKDSMAFLASIGIHNDTTLSQIALEDLQRAYACALAYHPDDLPAFLYKASKEGWQPSKEKPSPIFNRDQAVRIERDLISRGKLPNKDIYMEVLNKYVEIGFRGGNAQPTVIEYDERDFKTLLNKRLQEFGLS